MLRWAFLVRRDQLTELDDEMTAVRGEFPALTFRYVGPLPPVHFLARVTAAPPAADAFDSNGTWGW